MIDLVRKHIVILAGAVLGWSGYSFYDAGQAKPEAQAKAQMTEIGPKFMALRDPSVAFVVSNDPYRFEGAAERVVRSVPAHAATHAAAAAGADAAASVWDDSFVGPILPPPAPPLSQGDLVVALAGALRLANEALARGVAPATGLAAAPAEPRRAGFVLVLQSTLDLGVGAQARINGRTVEEGEAMPFLDALDPPVLQRVQNTSIVVSHDGREYVVDLLANPVLQVGEPAVAAAAAAAPAAGPPAKQAAPAASPAPATGGSASGAAKPKGTYRVRGKNSKKP